MLQQIAASGDANLHWIVALAVALMLGVQVEKWHTRKRRRKWQRQLNGGNAARREGTSNLRAIGGAATPGFDASVQLRDVMEATFTARPLLNRKEARLFAALERIVAAEAPGCRVMAQVSLGEILASPSDSAFRAVNSKRVDLLLIDQASMPLHAIEYQGAGHFSAPTTAARDAIKREALRRAGIGYVEVQAGDTPAELASLIRKLVART